MKVVRTPWFDSGENPREDRPGNYEIEYARPGVRRIILTRWTGTVWRIKRKHLVLLGTSTSIRWRGIA